ncbi:unnamed protein product, partial [Meganyctiphanes norvegica]
TFLVALVALSQVAADDYGHQPSYNAPTPYSFSYGVNDDYSKASFGQSEKGDGKAVEGYYTVDLPDGRTQTVKYSADHHKGYVAEVSYSGKAQYAKGGPAETFFKGGHGGGGGYH